MNEKYNEVWDIVATAMRSARDLGKRPFDFELDLIAANHTKAILRAVNGE